MSVRKLTIVVLLIALLFAAAGVLSGAVQAASPCLWAPTLTGTIDQSTIPLGATAKIRYSAPDATGCQYGIRQWGSVIGWSDGVPIPTSGVLQITPALPGTFVVTIVAAKRLLDLNRDGKFDGRRRTVSLSFPITVKGGPSSPWDGVPDFKGKLWFDPPQIKRGESTMRRWTSEGGTAYLDGQRVPASGQDVLRPVEDLTSILQVTAGRRWKFVRVERATVVVKTQ